MCMDFTFDFGTFKILVDLIEDEMQLYNEEDLLIIMQGSFILFTRSLLAGSAKFFNR